MKSNISWNKFFMGAALLAAKRSKDPNTKVGAAVASPENKLIGIGYNGFPAGSEDYDFPWDNRKNIEYLKTKYPYVCHAELNAILNCIIQPKGCSLYATLFPCNECAKVIIQSGIKKVYYLSDKYKDTEADTASRNLFNACEIPYEKLYLTGKLEINFEEK